MSDDSNAVASAQGSPAASAADSAAGDADVDALLSRLRVIEDQPLEERAEAFTQLHDELRGVLRAVTDEVTGRGTAWIAPLVRALGREMDAWAHAAHPGDPADLEALRARLAAACEAFATGSDATPGVDRVLEPEGADRG